MLRVFASLCPGVYNALALRDRALLVRYGQSATDPDERPKMLGPAITDNKLVAARRLLSRKVLTGSRWAFAELTLRQLRLVIDT